MRFSRPHITSVGRLNCVNLSRTEWLLVPRTLSNRARRQPAPRGRRAESCRRWSPLGPADLSTGAADANWPVVANPAGAAAVVENCTTYTSTAPAEVRIVPSGNVEDLPNPPVAYKLSPPSMQSERSSRRSWSYVDRRRTPRWPA